MNVEKYISSGVLEAYILGDLSKEEQIEVEQCAKKYSVIRQEIDAIEIALEKTAFNAAINPGSDVKNKIFEKIGIGAESKIIPMPKNNFSRYLVAASVTLALISSIAAVNYWTKWKGAEDRLSNLISQNQVLADNFNTASQEINEKDRSLAILTDTKFKKIIMNGVTPGDLVASVYWNSEDGNLYLNAKALPQLPTDKQYQLWALVDGQPIDAGVFETSEDIHLIFEMKSMTAADAFAVTIEPRGGSVSPTLEDLQVIGNV